MVMHVSAGRRRDIPPPSILINSRIGAVDRCCSSPGKAYGEHSGQRALMCLTGSTDRVQRCQYLRWHGR